jgi:hypothetical protein
MLAHAKRLMALGLVLLSLGGAMACTRSGKTVAGKEEARAPTTGAQDRVPGGDAGAPITGTQDRAPGEYLVTVQKGGDQALIRKLFASFSVKDVRSLGEGQFLLKIEKDPGPEAVKKKGEESDRIRSVQPNFVYRLSRPKT